mmetsp:Transcript_8576/g.21324  ORF Transcript_8576/g.21324 Transcript_8576/m.21324 type:complete len:107 (-) Transcript_8576:277-597(-)
MFGTKSWVALAKCPRLEVLWVDNAMHDADCRNKAVGDIAVIRRAIILCKELKLCMVNPDQTQKSRYILGGARKTDRLEGDKVKKSKKRSKFQAFESYVSDSDEFDS